MDKWAMIFLMVLCGALFSPIIVTEYSKGTCKTEAIRAGMSADDILKLCK